MDVPEVCEKLLAFKTYLENRGCDIWGLIVHDADLDENCDPVNPHIHFAYHITDKNSVRLSTELNSLSKALGVDTLAVSIGKNKSFEYAFQYFIHKPYPEKHQYPKEHIVTNLDVDTLQMYLDADVKNINEEYLIEVVARAYTKSDIVRTIGLYYYRVYRGIICDLWNEFHEVREVRERKRTEKEKRA